MGLRHLFNGRDSGRGPRRKRSHLALILLLLATAVAVPAACQEQAVAPGPETPTDAIAEEPDAPTPSPTVGEREVDYANEALGFGIDPIAGWSTLEDADRVSFSRPDGAAVFQVVVYESRGETLFEIMEREAARFQEDHPDAQLIEDDIHGLVNEREALRSYWRFSGELGDRSLNIVVTENAGREYVMTFRAPWVYLEGSSIFETFVHTFRFF